MYVVICNVRSSIFNVIQESEYKLAIGQLVEEKEAALQGKLVAEKALSDLLRDTQDKDAAHAETRKFQEVNRRTSGVKTNGMEGVIQ